MGIQVVTVSLMVVAVVVAVVVVIIPVVTMVTVATATFFGDVFSISVPAESFR